MGHHASIINEAIQRLDSLMAIGESRREAKMALREALEGSARWSVSTGLIHSYQTRTTYQEQILRFVNWGRDQHQLTRLAAVDLRASTQ